MANVPLKTSTILAHLAVARVLIIVIIVRAVRASRAYRNGSTRFAARGRILLLGFTGQHGGHCVTSVLVDLKTQDPLLIYSTLL
jgi:hypothetical protein